MRETLETLTKEELRSPSRARDAEEKKRAAKKRAAAAKKKAAARTKPGEKGASRAGVKSAAKKAAVAGARKARGAKTAKVPGPQPMVPISLPPRSRATLGNGLRVIVARRRQVPLVSLRLTFEGGSAQDPRGRHGLADLTVRLLRRGAGGLSADALNEAIELYGASVGVGASDDALHLSVSTPSEHLEPVLELIGKMVAEPTFAQEEVESLKQRILGQLAHAIDDPGELAQRAFARAFYGTHPYGHDVWGTRAHVRRIDRAEIVKFHAERMGPRTALLVAVGDVAPMRLIRAAEKAFGGWTGGPESILPTADVGAPAHAGKILLVDREAQSQSQIRLGTTGFRRGHADHIAASVTNAAFGGSFTSRLMEKVRVKSGLTYGISSHFESLRAGGCFQIATFTKCESTAKVIKIIEKEAAAARRRGFTELELTTIKTWLCGLFPLRLETNGAVAAALTDLTLYELPADWIERYRERVQAVTLEQTHEIARKYLLPGDVCCAVVGKASEIESQLEELGEVERVDATKLT